MTKKALIIILLSLLCYSLPSAYAQTSSNPVNQRGTAPMQAKGTFEVKLEPQEFMATSVDATNLGRMSIDKQFSGDLDASSKGEMLMAMTATAGSAAYVAIEQVNGSLAGKKGAFVLQHFGTRESGNERLILEVVPDSGSGELEGIRGKMAIIIEDGQHRYEFEYTL